VVDPETIFIACILISTSDSLIGRKKKKKKKKHMDPAMRD